jgi:long-subunit acyl-CoA synthetase (AMP-forming)
LTPPARVASRYGEYYGRINNLGSGLAKLSELSKGSTVIIYAETQKLWMLSAFAAWRQGYVVGTIYATLGADGAEFGINQSGAKMVFADGKLLKVLASIASKLTQCKRVMVFKAEDMDGPAVAQLKEAGIEVTTLAEIEESGANAPQVVIADPDPDPFFYSYTLLTPYPEPYHAQEPTPSSPEETAVLMYTSGTTGNPKGVLISHANIASLVAATLLPTGALGGYIKAGYKYLAYLPLAHIMELAVEAALFSAGFVIGYGSPGTLTPSSIKMLQPNEAASKEVKKKVLAQLGDAAALQPDIFVAAPAVLDKILIGVRKIFGEKKGLIKMAIEGGLRRGKAIYDKGGKGTSGFLSKIVFKKVQARLGGKVKIMVTGSAPLSAEVQKFVQTVFNCPVRQGYGLTETCAGTCITLARDNSTMTVGPPQECACIRLRDWEEGNYRNSDVHNKEIGMRRGEVLIGGPMVCQGYLENPAMPDEELSAKNRDDFVTIDGVRYFCTGDIGQFTLMGNLQIIDRKKDLVKLQMGEYVALSKVENALKASKFTILPMCYAKSTMSYCIALVCPNEGEMRKIDGAPAEATFAELCKNEAVIKAITADMQACCKSAKLQTFETPTKVVLIDDLWTPENDMLTAVQKLKRKPIEAKHKDQIEAAYV